MINIEIHNLRRKLKIPLWQIADELGVCENTVQRKLRHELTEAEKERFIQAIKSISQKKESTSDDMQ